MFRNLSINVRFHESEMEAIDRFRAGSKLSRSAYIRQTALSTPPVVIPSINREQWAELSRVASNLNQLAHLANDGFLSHSTEIEILKAKDLLRDVRSALIGVEAE